jgi:hypothetical protein
VQATAAAQAGVSVIQPNIGRLDDWYNKHPGVIRDPKAGAANPFNQCACLWELPAAAACMAEAGFQWILWLCNHMDAGWPTRVHLVVLHMPSSGS